MLGEQRLGFQLLGGRDVLGEQDVAFRSGELAQEEVVRLRLHVHLQTSFLAAAAQRELEGRVSPVEAQRGAGAATVVVVA